MKKIIFFGTPDFAVPSLQSLINLGLVAAVVTQPDKPAGRNKKLKASPIKTLAEKNSIPVLDPLKLNEDFINDLKKHLPASFVVVAYGKIIPQAVLNLSEKQAINIHPSKLPILRGPSPIQTAILEGFDNTAVSLMLLDEEMDHGPILSQLEVNILPTEGYLELSERLSVVGAKLLADNIEKYLSDELKAIPQDDSKATYCQMIKKEDGKIDWDTSAEQIQNKIRALNPWPSTYTSINGLDLKVLKVGKTNKRIEQGKIEIESDKLFIGTSTSALEIIELQPSGKKAMLADEFLRGYKSKL